jgi:tetratricopeptide (TPR) repeat protein
MIPLILHLALAAAQAGTLSGYVFRETDGNPPRRPMTVELSDGDRTRYRETTEASGMFMFRKVQEGHYTIRVRFGDFIAVDDRVTIAAGEKDFAAVMLPKRRAKAQGFRAVTADQLASQSDRELQKSLRKAAKLVSRHDLSGAARVYEQAAAVGPTAGLWDTLGILYLQMGRKADAISVFEKAIAQDPEYLLPYAHLGWFYQQERRYTELLKLAARALAADPEWMTGHSLLGEARVGTGDLGTALQSIAKASALVQGKAPGPYLLMAQIRYLRQDCAGARKDLDRYLELNTSARDLPGTAKVLALLEGCRSGGFK